MPPGVFDTPRAAPDSYFGAMLHDLDLSSRFRNTRAIAAAALAAFAFGLTAWLAPPVAMVIAALVAAVFLAWSCKFLFRHPLYLVFMLVVIEEIPALMPLGDSARVIVRYSLYVFLLIPTIPMALRTGLLGRGCFRLYCLYFGWALITVMYSIAPAYSAGRLIGAALSFMALIAAIGQVDDDSKATEMMFLALMALGALLGILALAEVVLPSSITWSHPVAGDPESYGVPRFKGIFDNPNQVGSITLPGVTLGLVAWTRLTGSRRRWATIAIALGLVLTLMADSRSVLVSIAVGCACYIVWRYRMKGLIACVAIALAFVAALATFESDYFFRGAGTLTGRTDIWRFSIAKLWEHPLLGYGYQVDGAIFDSRYFPMWWGPWFEGPHSSLHNEYLSRAIGLGIPCTIFWFYLTLKPFRDLFRRTGDPWRLKPMFMLIIVPMLVRSMAEADVSDCVYPAGVVMALMWAMAERERLISADRRRAEMNLQSTTKLAAALAGAIAFLIVLGARPASATTYYVDPAGSDGNAGTAPSSAWRTVAKVSGAVLEPGDIVAFKADGEWRETLAPLSSGTLGHPITFTRYGSGAAPIISGAQVVSGWQRERDDVWSAPLESAPANIYAGGDLSWGLAHSESASLTSPGSWYWSAGRLFIRLANGGPPASQSIEAAVREEGFLVDGAHGNNNDVASSHFSYSGGHGGRSGSIASNVSYIVVDGIEVQRTGGWGIHFYDSISPVVRHCIVHETGPGRRDLKYHNAIHADIAPGARFENNDVAFSGGHGNAISCQRADGARITGNHVRRWYHNGLDVKESSSVVVSGNDAQESSDGSGVYGEYDANLNISGNTIHEVVTGVQVNLGTSALITGNSISGASTAIFIGPRGASATLANNCARNSRFALIDAGHDSIIEDHNDWGIDASVKLGERLYPSLAEYREAGYGAHDTLGASSPSCP